MKSCLNLCRNGSMCLIALMVTIVHVSTSSLSAETWTDNTGNFKIEAEFVGLQGDKVVLKKPNGATVEVPLRRLNAAGQELAKKLASKPATSTTSSVPSATASATGAQAPDAYLRELIAASEAGEYKKVWNALPASYQKDVHDLVHSFAANMDAGLWSQGTGLLRKAVRILKDKQQFILGHPAVAQGREVLAKALPPMADVLDAIVSSELADLQKLKTFDFERFAAGDGKKIADKIKTASKAAEELKKFAGPGPGAIPGGPDAAPNPFSELAEVKAADVKIIVVKHEGDTAVLKFEVKGKPSPEVAWVKVEGKWLPKEMVDDWQSEMAMAKQWTSTEMKQKVAEFKAQAGQILPLVNTTLDQLLAAQTQEQFNQIVASVLQMFGGAGAPGGIPPGAGGVPPPGVPGATPVPSPTPTRPR